MAAKPRHPCRGRLPSSATWARVIESIVVPRRSLRSRRRRPCFPLAAQGCPVFPRLKPHKQGARHALQPSDVVIASYFPVSVTVHQVRAIISNDHDSERGEWQSTQPFKHNTVSVGAAKVRELEQLLGSLATLQPWSNVEGYHEEYEEVVRRLLRFRANDIEVHAFLPRHSLWDKFQVSPEGVRAFETAWCAVWSCFGNSEDLTLSTPSTEHS